MYPYFYFDNCDLECELAKVIANCQLQIFTAISWPSKKLVPRLPCTPSPLTTTVVCSLVGLSEWMAPSTWGLYQRYRHVLGTMCVLTILTLAYIVHTLSRNVGEDNRCHMTYLLPFFKPVKVTTSIHAYTPLPNATTGPPPPPPPESDGLTFGGEGLH